MLANQSIRKPIHGVKFNVAVIGITRLSMVMVGHFNPPRTRKESGGEALESNTETF